MPRFPVDLVFDFKIHTSGLSCIPYLGIPECYASELYWGGGVVADVVLQSSILYVVDVLDHLKESFKET